MHPIPTRCCRNISIINNWYCFFIQEKVIDTVLVRGFLSLLTVQVAMKEKEQNNIKKIFKKKNMLLNKIKGMKTEKKIMGALRKEKYSLTASVS